VNARKLRHGRYVRFVVLFDTTFFIDLEEELALGRPGAAHAFLLAHKAHAREASVVTMGEFAVGVERVSVARMFRGYRPLALGRELAIYAGRLQANLSFEMGENDLWIAATGLYYGLPLVTRDAAFSQVPGLRVLSY
jgi:predicted nucleic acid-binding protein